MGKKCYFIKFAIRYGITIFLLLWTTELFSQNESYPCNCCNPGIKKLFDGDTLNCLYVHSCNGVGLGNVSTSFLLPSSPPPKIIEYQDGPPDDAAYVNWTCTYAAGNLCDGTCKTAWVEGVDGEGIGEGVIVPCLNLKQPTWIWPGYGKSQELFLANNRPKIIKLMVIQAERVSPPQEGDYYVNLKVINETTQVLNDLNEYQRLDIPDFKIEKYYSKVFSITSEYHYFLGIEILGVYSGTKYSDTCISEVTNLQ